MELSHSLLLNEAALKQTSEPNKPVFFYEWLKYLERILPVTQKADIRHSQKQLVEQLTQAINSGPGPTTRVLLAKCLSQTFLIADSYDLLSTINHCNDCLKPKNDANSQISVKLTSLAVLGAMYETLGKMVGGSYEESLDQMTKWMKSAESTSRADILLTLSKLIRGLGPTAYSRHRDIFKLVSKNSLTDRVMFVRVAAVRCLHDLCSEFGSPIYPIDVDSIVTMLLKAIDKSNNEVRFEVAKVFGKIGSYAVNNKEQKPVANTSQQSQPTKTVTLELVLKFMSEAFIRGGIGGFLKSGTSAGGHKEIRVGIALAYVELARELGSKWLERNLFVWQRHLFELAYNIGPMFSTDSASSAIDTRHCVSYIFRQTLGLMLSENAQINACKNFGLLINEYLEKMVVSNEDTSDRMMVDDGISSACTVALLEISALVRQVDSSIAPLFVEANGIRETVFECVTHPSQMCRLAAAWCLRCVIRSVPTQATPLIKLCLSRLKNDRKTPLAIAGYSTALAALTAGSLQTELGIPFQKTHDVFDIAEEMIRTASERLKLALSKLQYGWMLLASVLSMGGSYVRRNLSHLLPLWRCTFPRSVEEAKNEIQRGDAFTWECSLKSRAGAFASMEAFIVNAGELLNEEMLKQIVQLIEITLHTLSVLASNNLLRVQPILRHPVQLLRIRLYSLLNRIPFKYYEHLFRIILSELVADITLSDNPQLTTTASNLANMCTSVGECLLGGWLAKQNELEVQLHPSQCECSGALEYDPICVVLGSTSWTRVQELDADDPNWPQPLPSQVALLDAAIHTFGRIYPLLVTKHKNQLTDHFIKCLTDPKQKDTARFQAVEMNILGAILCAMRSMGDYRNARIEDEDLRRKTVQLLRDYVCSERTLLKCLAVEALGRLAQTIPEAQFCSLRTQEIFEDLRVKQDEKSRTGLTLALGCLYRYKGSLGSDQQFKKAVGDLLTFAQINASPTVQAWAILSLSLIASTGGGMFREYVKPSLEFCLRQLLNTPSYNVEVVQCIGKLVSALITVVGPELASIPTTPNGGGIEDIRQSCMAACSMMFAHSDPQVRAEAIACQQQLHLFAPRYVELDRLVASLCDLLYSPHQVLRRASTQCLKQLLQREAREVREHAQNLLPAGIIDQTKWKNSSLPESGLEGALFELLDLENDIDQRQNIKDCLLFLVQATSDEQLNFWLSICKDILASSTTTNSDSIMRSTLVIQDQKVVSPPSTHDTPKTGVSEFGINADDEDDDVLQSKFDEPRARDKVAPRWPTRVFAFTIVRKLMSLCDTERAHLDPALAKEFQMLSHGRSDYLVFHLSDLVRMSFMGATSENSSLRLAGLACLQDIIDRFAEVPEPEVHEPHVILEQFQAQVSAALGPAFDSETPSHVTAAACQVCSAWICSGVARNLNDLRRVNQLLVSSLDKLKDNSMNAQLYNESAATLEKLSILKAWAEVYVVAQKSTSHPASQSATAWPGSAPQTPAVHHVEFDYSNNSAALLDLVNPELTSLVGHWLAALRDAAMLSLSGDFELPLSGGAFYTNESAEACREYYHASASSLLLAASMWLRQQNFGTTFNPKFEMNKECEVTENPIAFQWTDKERKQHFDLILAMSVESLCTNRSAGEDRLIHSSLDTLANLIECQWAQLQLMSDVRLPIEIMNVLHRLILTNDNLQVQIHCADLVQSLLNAAGAALKAVANEREFDNGNLPETLRQSNPTSFDGYDPQAGRIHAQSSLVFATLEVCLCLLVRQIPQVNPTKSNPIAPLHFRKYGRLSSESNELIKRAISLLTRVSPLCTSHGAIVIMPSVMFLILGVLKESSRIDSQNNESPPGHITEAAQAAIKAIRTIVSRPPADESFEQWASIIRSSLLSLLKISDDEQRGRVDEAVVMVATCVILTNLPSRLFIGATLFQQVCQLIRACLESSNFDVQYKALQTINSLFSRREIAAVYVKELGPIVFAKLKPYLMSKEGEKKLISETDLPVLSNLSDSELLTIQETIKAVESVLAMAKGEKEFTFVNLLTRCLARFLCPEPEKQLNEVSENVRKLHEFAYQHLNLIGPAHPESFSRLIKNSTNLRNRIESAAQVIAKQQELEKRNVLLQKQKALIAQQQALKIAQQQPAIKLKDFGNN